MSDFGICADRAQSAYKIECIKPPTNFPNVRSYNWNSSCWNTCQQCPYILVYTNTNSSNTNNNTNPSIVWKWGMMGFVISLRLYNVLISMTIMAFELWLIVLSSDWWQNMLDTFTFTYTTKHIFERKCEYFSYLQSQPVNECRTQ